MKVILLADVKKVGKKDEVVEVSDGYAMNFLIKKNLAVAYTKGSKGVLEKQQHDKELQEQALEAQANEIKKQLEGIVLEFHVKTGEGGRVFGGVSSKQIVAQLFDKHGVKVDKRKILDKETISSLGYTNVRVDLYRNKVIGTIRVHVNG